VKKIIVVSAILTFLTMVISGCGSFAGTHAPYLTTDVCTNGETMQMQKRDDNCDATRSHVASPSTQFLLPYFEVCPITIAEELLSQYISIFFGAIGLGYISDEPVIAVNRQDIYDDGVSIDWYGYFTDGYGEVIYDVPFIRNLYGVFNPDRTTPVWAADFQLFTIDGNYMPLIIAIRSNAIEFTGGGYVLYEIISSGNEFVQLGSMITWWSGGGGAPTLIPFINEIGEVITYMLMIGDGIVHKINSEGKFEEVGFLEFSSIEIEDGGWLMQPVEVEDFEKLLENEKQLQTLIPNFPAGNFTRMTRLYDLEQELTERIKENLRGTFPIATPPASD